MRIIPNMSPAVMTTRQVVCATAQSGTWGLAPELYNPEEETNREPQGSKVLCPSTYAYLQTYLTKTPTYSPPSSLCSLSLKDQFGPRYEALACCKDSSSTPNIFSPG